MRKLLLLGTTGLFLAFGAVGANAQSIQNRPEASPFALLNQRQVQPSNDPLNGMVSLFEGRAAFTQGAADNSALTTERHLHGRNFQ